MPSARLIRRVLAVVVLLAAVLAVWCGWRLHQVQQDLSRAVEDAQTLQTSVQSGDRGASRRALEDLQTVSDRAADRTSGPTWSVLAHLPEVGDDARGVRAVSHVVADLGEQGIGPLLDAADDLQSLLPKNGTIPVDTVAGLQQPVAQGSAAFADAATRLDAEDPRGFQHTLQSKYVDLQRRVEEVAKALSSADTALDVLPTMLAPDGTRHYLLVFENNAEIRGTGGLYGASSLLTVTDGKIELTKQLPGSTGYPVKAALPLTDAERKIYGNVYATYFLNAGMAPDFPRAAALAKAHWEQEQPETIDGVFAVDPVALSYILGATGPVSVGDVTLSSDNAVDELLHGVYLRYPNPPDQDAFFQQAAQAIFDKFTSGQGSPQDLLKALARGADEHRLLVHSFDDAEQADLAGTEVAGEFVTESTSHPQVGVTVNDATGAKMSYYLRYDVSADATTCGADGSQTISGRAHFLSDAPDDIKQQPDYVTGGAAFGTPIGAQTVVIRLFGPVGGTIDRLMVNGKPEKAVTVDQEGRPVASLPYILPARRTIDLSWRMTSGGGQSGDPQITVTPSVVAANTSSTTPSACG